MPELNSRAIKKWIADFAGLAPTLDFSNGVRTRDVAIDTGTSPSRTWICSDNTIGSPVWRLESQPLSDTIPDNTAGSVPVGDISIHGQILVAYTARGGAYNQEGLVRISHNGVDLTHDHEFSGSQEVQGMEVYPGLAGNIILLYFDTTAGVGTHLRLVYNILSQLPI